MSENSLKLQAFIREINGTREKYRADGFQKIREYYRSDDRKTRPPSEFIDSSFMFIRSHIGDIGYRPLPNVVFWNSPDISFTLATTSTPITTNEIRGGETYIVRCLVHNRGDLSIPFPKVEFFLTDPTLGFDTRFSTYLGVSQMDGILLAGGTGEVFFTYRVPATEGGHKCFFARAFSMSPLDKPHDLFSLYPVTDRHIGQKNLNIVTPAVPYSFNIVHMLNANETIQFVPLTMKDLIGSGDPHLGEFNFREKVSASLFSKTEIRVEGESTGRVARARAGFRLTSKGDGPSLDDQASFDKRYLEALNQVSAGKAKPSRFRELFNEKKKMNEFVRQTKLSMQLPDFNLEKGEAVGFNIVNTNATTGIVKGGITLVIIG